MKELVNTLNDIVVDQDIIGSVRTVVSKFQNPKLSIGMGKEGQVLAHMIFKEKLPIEVFTIDTGRLYEETYDLIERVGSRYGRGIKVYYPNQDLTQELVLQQGINGFYESLEKRQNCCFMRKVEPLIRALADADLWITGLRAGQSENRRQMNRFEWNEDKQLIKFNPIFHWSKPDVDTYLIDHKVPFNALHDKGFASIGCAPCTRATKPGEDPRAGRWWWENSKKECGLHQATNPLITA